MLAALLQDVFLAVDARADDIVLETRARTLRLASLMVLQAPDRPSGPEEAGQHCVSNGTRKQVRRRVQLAEAGRWAELASELQIRCEAAAAHGPAHDEGRQAPSELRVMEQACAKVRGNCCKAAAQLLGGPSPLPPSEATEAATLQSATLLHGSAWPGAGRGGGCASS